MRRVSMLAALLFCAGVAVAQAQKSAPLITRDTDHDGVPDMRDRCRGTPAGTHVDANGCPAPVPAAPTQMAAAPVNPPVAAPPAAAPATNPAPGPQPSAPAAAPAQNPPATTPAGQAAAPAGQPAANKPPGAAPSGLPSPAPTSVATQAVTPPVTVPAPAANPPARPATTPANPPATVPAAVAPLNPPRPAADPTMTAGFWMPLYTGRTDADQLEYARSLVLKLDSAIVGMVEIFRNTSGVPLAGANSPNVLSAREKGRWTRCRLFHLDLTTIGEAVESMKDSIAGGPGVARGIAVLSEAFTDLAATSECDNLGSMIEAPDRWAPWQANYESSARNFYKDWYTQLRTVHEANRTFARALLPALPAARQFPVPAGLPRTPPTIGAVR